MKWKSASAFVPALLITTTMALAFPRALRADDHDDGRCRDGDKHCVETRSVCFNVFCNFTRDKDSDSPVMQPNKRYHQCHAAAVFNKLVTEEGREVWDVSRDHEDNPQFEVACDGNTIFNNSAHRYTDWQGSRIQAIEGPFPAVVIPPASLRDTHQYVTAALELWDQTIHGYCYIYTGPQ